MAAQGIELLFIHVYVVLKSRENATINTGLSWVENPQMLLICIGKSVDLSTVKWQVGKRQFFPCKKYWAGLFFNMLQHPVELCPEKTSKLHLQG